MPLREAEAFVIKSHPLGESDRVITFLTRRVGKLRGVARGARRSRRRFGSNLELLSRVRLSYFEKEGVDLSRVESAELLESFYELQSDPERGAVLACFAEIADAFAREQQEDERFFRLLHAVLRAVRSGLDLDWSGRYFEVWTLRLHGVLPDLANCSGCSASLAARGALFRRSEGSVVCRGCGGARRAGEISLPPASIAAAEQIRSGSPESLIGALADHRALRALGETAQALFFDLTERRFRSYQVLRELRGEK